MVIINEGKDNQFYMDGFLKQNLDVVIKKIKKDWDMVFVIDGVEGSGKSTLAMQMACYCDPTFCIERVVFTPRDLRQAIINSQKFQAIVYDEAYTGLSSRATMSLINRTLISMLAEIRQRNLYVFVVMPTFFDLDKYVALWRSRALFHVYVDKDFNRGFFAFFNANKKKLLYIAGKKFYSYSKVKANFLGRFYKNYVVDEQAYREKKRNSLMSREKAREEMEVKREVEFAMFERVADMDISHKEKLKILGIPEGTYWLWLRKRKEQQEFG